MWHYVVYVDSVAKSWQPGTNQILKTGKYAPSISTPYEQNT